MKRVEHQYLLLRVILYVDELKILDFECQSIKLILVKILSFLDEDKIIVLTPAQKKSSGQTYVLKRRRTINEKVFCNS
jgi:hypothetical protein